MALGHSTTTVYDATNNVTKIIDPVNNTTTFDYDALNRVIAETNELEKTRSYRYDAVGNLSEMTDRNNRTIQYVYDEIYRRTNEIWLSTTNEPIRTINYSYDAINQLLTASDPDSNYSYIYDAAQRLTSVSNVGTPETPEVILTYTYDENGNKLTTTDTINSEVAGTNNYVYDALNRLTQVNQSGDGVADKRVDMTYDAASRMIGQTRYSDLNGIQLVAGTDYTYDDANRLTNLSHKQGSTILANYGYTYDAANRITQIISPDGTSDYTYDDRDQLTDAEYDFQSNEDYIYDENGNRINTGYNTGENNQLLSDGIYSYEYDGEGNRIRRTELASGKFTEYIWDYRNRLEQVITQDSNGNILNTAGYTYDVFDRRIAKEIDSDGSGDSESERLIYDGDHITLSFDGTGDITHRYLYGANIDQILADEDAQGDILWPLTDHQGTVRDLIDSTGSIQNHITYSSFGAITNQTNPDIDHRFSYTGREFDEETGQYYYRARYYDDSIGQFISEDPIGFTAGDENLYRYVKNNVARDIDPLGLESFSSLFSSDNISRATTLVLNGEGILPSGEAIWNGIRGIPSAILEPVFIVTDIVTAFGVSANNLVSSNKIYAEDISFDSALGRRLNQNVIEGKGAEAHARAAIVSATAMPTGGGSVLLDNLFTVSQGGMSPQQAADFLGSAATTQAGVAGIGVAVSYSTGSGLTGRGGSVNLSRDQALVCTLIEARQVWGLERAGEVTVSALERSGQLPYVNRSVPTGRGTIQHAEPRALSESPTLGPRTVAVDQVPCPNCARTLQAQGMRGTTRVLVPRERGNPTGSPKGAAKRAAQLRSPGIEANTILYFPFEPPLTPGTVNTQIHPSNDGASESISFLLGQTSVAPITSVTFTGGR